MSRAFSVKNATACAALLAGALFAVSDWAPWATFSGWSKAPIFGGCAAAFISPASLRVPPGDGGGLDADRRRRGWRHVPGIRTWSLYTDDIDRPTDGALINRHPIARRNPRPSQRARRNL